MLGGREEKRRCGSQLHTQREKRERERERAFNSPCMCTLPLRLQHRMTDFLATTGKDSSPIYRLLNFEEASCPLIHRAKHKHWRRDVRNDHVQLETGMHVPRSTQGLFVLRDYLYAVLLMTMLMTVGLFLKSSHLWG